MAVKIRLARRGRKKLAIYDVVVSDVRAPRDGRFIEKIGNYNPNTNPATVIIDEDRAFHWVMVGAQPTDTVRAMLSYRGVMYRKHLQVGVEKGAITQEEADKKLAKWLEDKRAQIQKKVDSLAEKESTAAKKRIAAEVKANEARIEKILKKSAALEAAAVAAVSGDSDDSDESVEETSEEAVAEATETTEVETTPEAVTEEVPAVEEAEAETKEEVVAEEAPAETQADVKTEVVAEAATEEAPVAEETPAEDSKEEEKKG